MEIFGIFFSIPVALVASSIYCFFLAKVVLRHEHACRILRKLSYVVLSLFAVELTLLSTLGAVRTRAVLGPGFYLAHVIFFFLGVPALGNLLVLRRNGQPWYVAAVLCTALAFLLVLLQYGVSEALYGIDGDDGPFSELILQTNSGSRQA
jgi:hypothetical protein